MGKGDTVRSGAVDRWVQRHYDASAMGAIAIVSALFTVTLCAPHSHIPRAAAFLQSSTQQEPVVLDPLEVSTQLMLGSKLSASEAATLEGRVRAEGNYAVGRAKLIGYYFGSPSESAGRARHVLWFIEHHPECVGGSRPHFMIDAHVEPQAFGRGKELWLDHIKRSPGNREVLASAASYFYFTEPSIAKEILTQGRNRFPSDVLWPQELGLLERLAIMGDDGVVDKEAAGRALSHYEAAVELVEERGLAHLGSYVAWCAFLAGESSKARLAASEVLALSDESRGFGWDKADFHRAYMVLGLLECQAGDLIAAERSLLRSVAGVDEGDRVTFDPNMLLAHRLVQQGRRGAVIEYLSVCAKIWKAPTFQDWIDQLERGAIPKFGAYLRY